MAVPIKMVFTRKNDQFIEIDGLQDPTTGAFVNNATVTATLVDQYGNAVPGCTNVTLNYLATTNGNYRGLVEQTFNPIIGAGYTLQVTATAPGQGVDNTVDLFLEIPAVVTPRVN